MSSLRTSINYTFIALTLIWLIVFLIILGFVSQKKMPAGLAISGWQLEELSYERFIVALDTRVSALEQYQVKLTDSTHTTVTGHLSLKQLGLQIDQQALLERLQGLRTGSLYQRAQCRWRLRNANIELPFTFDHTAMEQALRQTWSSLYEEKPANAQRFITADDQVQIAPGKNAYRVDTLQLEALLIPLVSGSLWSHSENSQMASLVLPLKQINPEITEEMMMAQGVKRKLVEFSTTFPADDPGRIHNIRSTAQMVHDVLLKPGDIFDYSQIIAQTEAHFGFRNAPVIVNGKIVPGIGGGICQVSTTLYNAVLRSGLEVVERRNHSLPISYAELGQDATFASGHINFKFRNNTSNHVLIRTETTERQITVKLFGDAPSETTYEIESKVLETLPISEKYVHNPLLPIGRRQIVMKGKPGYIVETYRYKKENGIM